MKLMMKKFKFLFEILSTKNIVHFYQCFFHSIKIGNDDIQDDINNVKINVASNEIKEETGILDGETKSCSLARF